MARTAWTSSASRAQRVKPAGQPGSALAQQGGEVEPQAAQPGGVGGSADPRVALADHQGEQLVGGGDAAEVPVRQTFRRGVVAGGSEAAGCPLAAGRATAWAMPMRPQQQPAPHGFLVEALA